MKGVRQFLTSPPVSPDIDVIRKALAAPAPAIDNPDQLLAPKAYDISFKQAAVLMAIWASPDAGLQVLLTQRAKHMRNHPGQIALPGGQMDPEDQNVIHTALRETEEEVGLAPDRFNLLGELGDYFTISGFRVKPVIAEVQQPSPLVLCQEEVEAVYWIPLDYLLTPAHYRFQERMLGQQKRGYFEVEYENVRIWGVTAGIFYGLYNALADSL